MTSISLNRYADRWPIRLKLFEDKDPEDMMKV
jgi:hypothetical protein